MTPPKGRNGGGFHELPLVLFTALATAGAGVGVSHLGLACLRWSSWVPPVEVLLGYSILLSLGFLSSAGHLGRPLRGPMALVRVGKSPLSNEVLVVGIAVTTGLLAVVLPSGHVLGPPLSLAAILSSVPLLLALGLVYSLPNQLTWGGLAPAHPLVLGLGFGLTVLLGTLPEGTRARGELLVLLILLIDGLLVWERSWRIGRALGLGAPSHPGLMAQRGSALILRVLLGILLPAVALLSGWWELAAFSLFLNLLFDRFLFYGLAVILNTEAEVMRVEAVLRDLENNPPFPSDQSPSFIRADES